MDDGWAQDAAGQRQLPCAVALSLDSAMNISAASDDEPREPEITGSDLYCLGQVLADMLEWSSARQRPRTEPVRNFWRDWLSTGTAVVTMSTGCGKTESYLHRVLSGERSRILIVAPLGGLQVNAGSIRRTVPGHLRC